MRHVRRTAWAALGLVVLSQGGTAQVPGPTLSSVQLPKGSELIDALYADVDGRGAADVVVARTDESGSRRILSVHLSDAANDDRLSRSPSATMDLPPDVVAFLVADVHPDPGAEVVLLNARGAFAWRPTGGAEPPIVRLFEVDFLWQIPGAWDGRAGLEVFAWPSGARDLNGDGLDDLCLPEPEGYRIALQVDDEVRFPRTHVLSIPGNSEGAVLLERGPGGRKGAARARRRNREVAVGFGEEGLSFEERAGPLVSIFETTPAPGIIDWDADGDLDVMAYTKDEVLVWRQQQGAGFASAPSLRLGAPVERDVGRELDVSFSAHAVELDGDGRADCVVFAGDKRSDDIRTQAMVFVRGTEPEADPLFGAEGVPRQLLLLAGFVATPRFADVDQDGRLDMILSVVRPDLIDAVRAASTERLDVQLYVYLNQGGTFSRRPDLEHKLSFAADSTEYSLRFVADVDGNGLLDLFVRDVDGSGEDQGRGRLVVHRLRKERDRLTLVERPLWELSIDEDARVRFPGAHLRRGGREAILVLEEEQLLCVRWR